MTAVQTYPNKTCSVDLRRLLTQPHGRLALAMIDAGISKQELAKRVTFTRQYLYKLIEGKQDLRSATGHVLLELSTLLQVSIDFLLGADLDLFKEGASD